MKKEIKTNENYSDEPSKKVINFPEEIKWFEEHTKLTAIRLERVMALMEILERGLEQEFDIEERKLTSLSYIIFDYLNEVKENIEILEKRISYLSS